LINFVSYKAEEADRRVEFVDPKNTSQECSRCGEIVKKSLSQRVHRCPFCGLVIDRDENAAINILKSGLQKSKGFSICQKPKVFEDPIRKGGVVHF
jgi:putative transposase